GGPGLPEGGRGADHSLTGIRNRRPDPGLPARRRGPGRPRRCRRRRGGKKPLRKWGAGGICPPLPIFSSAQQDVRPCRRPVTRPAHLSFLAASLGGALSLMASLGGASLVLPPSRSSFRRAFWVGVRAPSALGRASRRGLRIPRSCISILVRFSVWMRYPFCFCSSVSPRSRHLEYSCPRPRGGWLSWPISQLPANTASAITTIP